MKMAVIALMAVLVLGGGAAGAYFYFSKPAEASLGPADEAAKAEHEAKEAEAAEAAKIQEFVHIDPLIFPVIGETGVTQTVSLVVTIEVPSKEAAAEVERLSPRLKDAFIQDMYGALNRKNSMENGVLKVAPLKARLNKISAKVLGEDKVNEVLLQIIQQRRI